MPVQSLRVRDFSVFEEADFEFARGINVFVGPNGTGKTHVLKLLYAVMESDRTRDTARFNQAEYRQRLNEKLSGVFRPDRSETGRLARRKHGKSTALVDVIAWDHGNARARKRSGHSGIDLHFELHLGRGMTALARHGRGGAQERVPGGGGIKGRSIFLPTREVLAMYEGFIAAYRERELSFDETYYDACVALSALPLRGVSPLAPILVSLRRGLGGHAKLSGDRFYVKFRGDRKGWMEAHLVAEGLRKFAALERLVLNGSLRDSSFLFWDEPEANLNPQLIAETAEILGMLASEGIQIFLSTHDYLLARRLSLATQRPGSPPTRFFGFARSGNGPVEVTAVNRLEELKNNPMVDEFTKLYQLSLEVEFGK